jgi:hypothetical protein
MADTTDPRSARTKVPSGCELFLDVQSTATKVQAAYSLTRDGSPQDLVKLGHAMVWNRVNSFPIAIADGYWSRVDLIFSGPAETVVVNQWIVSAAGKKIREWSETFKHSANSYGWMEWRVVAVTPV